MLGEYGSTYKMNAVEQMVILNNFQGDDQQGTFLLQQFNMTYNIGYEIYIVGMIIQVHILVLFCYYLNK